MCSASVSYRVGLAAKPSFHLPSQEPSQEHSVDYIYAFAWKGTRALCCNGAGFPLVITTTSLIM